MPLIELSVNIPGQGGVPEEDIPASGATDESVVVAPIAAHQRIAIAFKCHYSHSRVGIVKTNQTFLLRNKQL